MRSATVVTDANKASEARGTVDAAVLDQVRAVPGVAAADAAAGRRRHGGRPRRRAARRQPATGPIPIAMAWQARRPAEPDGARRRSRTARRTRSSSTARRPTKGEFAVGDTIQRTQPDGLGRVPLAGIATYAGEDDAAGAQVVAFAPETAATVLGEPGRYDVGQRRRRSRVSRRRSSWRTSSAALNGSDVDVITGAERRSRRHARPPAPRCSSSTRSC